MLCLFALTVGAFGGSINLASGNPYVVIDVSGSLDCNVQVIDNNTSQVVLEVVVYVGLGVSIVSNNGGFTVSPSNPGTIEIYDLPIGDYEIRTTPPGSNWTSYNTGNSTWAMIVDYNYYSPDEIRTEIYNSSGYFY